MAKTKSLTAKERETLRQTNKENFFKSSRLDTNCYAPPYSQRDTTYDKVQPRQRDTDGSVIIGPKPFLAHKPKAGKSPDVYFSPPLSHNFNDPYVDPLKGRYQEEHIRAQKANKLHESMFKPGGPVHFPYSDYESLPQDPLFKRKIKRDEQGQVIIGPRNMITNPPKKGTSTTPDITISSYPSYKGDDYNSAKKLAEKQRAEHHKKLQENPFKPVSLYGNTFQNNIETFGGKVPDKSDRPPFYPSNPSKKGIFDKTIGRFPAYIEAPSVTKTAAKKFWKNKLAGEEVTKRKPRLFHQSRRLL